MFNCPNCGRGEVGNGLFCIVCQQFLAAPPGIHAAGLGRRVAAYLIDWLFSSVPIAVLLAILFIGTVIDSDSVSEVPPEEDTATAASPADSDTATAVSPTDSDTATESTTLEEAIETLVTGETDSEGGETLEFRPIFLLLLIPPVGYLIWWLAVLGRGQTPGKQLMSIRVIRVDGRASGWGWTFLREFGIKFAAVNAVSFVSGGIGLIVWIGDLVWAFWDKDRQALHDKIMRTVVIDERAYRQPAIEGAHSEF